MRRLFQKSNRMITDPNKTPEIIYIQENMNEQMYGVNQDGNLPGMVKYIRYDVVEKIIRK